LAIKPVLEEVKEKLQSIITENRLGNEPVQVKIGTLAVKQAIGTPKRQDYPILEGKEVMIEAEFQGSFGQAFTDRPHDFTGLLHDIPGLSLNTNDNRAIFIATFNAVTSHLGIAHDMRHCRNEEPEECASEIARHILADSGRVKIGLVGLQPAILENLVKVFGADNVCCTDLNPKNVSSQKFGAEIWDGRTETTRLISWCDLFLVTSSTIVNNTFDDIRAAAADRNKRLITFGVTGAGVSAMLGLERLCFRAH